MGKSSRNLYLDFGFHDQYAFSMVSYIARPLLFTIHKSIKDFDDKLLVSMPFLLDHIYKFHGFGFSWRNLELMPEIVDINKAPQLRELVGKIIDFLTNTHIQEIVGGLYKFRFNKAIIDELGFLSKISPQESAAFNFTLDESLVIKRHHKLKLRELENVYKPYFSTTVEPQHVHSISFIHMILGDLHLYDEEYDDAIIEYMEAVQLLRRPGHFENVDMDRFILIIRNALKLGLAFEKKKTYKSAYMTYARLAALIQESAPRNLDTLSQSTRLFYQPLIAKFQIVEKGNIGGIDKKDVDNLFEEFDFFSDMAQRGSLFPAEFEMQVGDILYYKNGLIPKITTECKSSKSSEEGFQKECIYCMRGAAICSPNKHVKQKILKKGMKTPCSACERYMNSLQFFCKNFLKIEKTKMEREEFLPAIFEKLEEKTYRSRNALAMRELGNIFSNIGDTFLSCATASERKLSNKFIASMLSIISKSDYDFQGKELRKNLTKRKPQLSKIEEIFVYYYLSAIFYRYGGEHKEYAFQLTKMLYVLREYISLKNFILSEKMLKEIKETIVRRAIQGIYRAYDNTHRLEIEKFKEIFESENESRFEFGLDTLDNISVSAEIKEIIVIFSEIKLLCTKDLPDSEETKNSRYSAVSRMYNRINELKYKTNLNYRILKFGSDLRKFHELFSFQNNSKRKQLFQKIAKNKCSFHNKDDQQKYLEFLVTDSIFCCHEIIKILKIFGTSFMINHSVIAASYKKMGDWTNLYCEYVKYLRELPNSDSENIQEKMQTLIGKADMKLIAPRYHYEMALRHYRYAKETHSEGKAYRSIVEDMSYLLGDYNDSLYHFCAALERYRINSGAVKKQIDNLNKKVKDSSLYKYENYLPRIIQVN